MDIKYRVIFMGTPEFAVSSLQVLIDHPQTEVVAIITQPDKPIGRSHTPQPSPVKQLATTHQFPIWTPAKVKNNSELIEQIKSVQPDIIIVSAYGKILPQEILDIPKMGIINVHGSLLPKYRGASPIAGSIINGDFFTGITLMKMVLEMDAGPIIATSQPIPIESTDTTVTLTQKLSLIGAELLQQSLLPYLIGQLTPVPQDENQATFVPVIKKEDGQINWQEDALTIERKIRAYHPWPSTYTFWQDKRLKIIQGEVLLSGKDIPGKIWVTPDKYPAVFTNQGSLKILKVQPEGKSVMSGVDYLRGWPQLIGSILK
ncbi:methionyl-tRNA formyltransferase [Patescibacteria group bacterium]|nr:methionyl-tRNA formyltransferase [Patescibacteria group bacterium]